MNICLCTRVQMMQQLYQKCKLVHADLSEYNMLWHQGKVTHVQSVKPQSFFW